MAKILIIDDDWMIRKLIVQMLSSAGHTTFEAPQGSIGLSLFRLERPSLVITDMVMPDMEGFETMRKLRREAPDLRIIAISGCADAYLTMAQKLGANRVLAKPFHPRQLIAAVDDLLSE
jgi:DNA-binding response OmpR family regulator